MSVITKTGVSPAVLEQVLATGNVSALSAPQRVEYLLAVCKTLGLNPMTRPLRFLQLNGQTVLYATRDATDQLRKLHQVSLEITHSGIDDGETYVVQVHATDKSGRRDSDLGAVPIGNLKGEARANVMLKAVTKAKRRTTLSICGLGFLDETEVSSIPGARVLADEPTTEPTRVNDYATLHELDDSIPSLDEPPPPPESTPNLTLRDAINKSVPLRQPKLTVAAWLDQFAATLERCSDREQVEAACLSQEALTAGRMLRGEARERLRLLRNTALARHPPAAQPTPSLTGPPARPPEDHRAAR